MYIIYIYYMYSFTVFMSTHHLQASQHHQRSAIPGGPPSAGAVQFVPSAAAAAAVLCNAKFATRGADSH